MLNLKEWLKQDFLQVTLKCVINLLQAAVLYPALMSILLRMSRIMACFFLHA